MTVEEAALGALQIQKYGMTQAIELNSVRRGYDPREFTLVAAGGAGPLFACDIALELEIARVLVPPHPASSLRRGCWRRTSSTSSSAPSATRSRASKAQLSARFDELVEQAVAQLDADAVRGRPPRRATARRLPLRRAGVRGAYGGAGRDNRRHLGGRAEGAFPCRARARVRPSLRRCDRDHQYPRRWHRAGGRVAAAPSSAGGGDASGAVTQEREVVFEVEGSAERHLTPFYEREQLRAGDRLVGPAIVEQYDTTTVIPPGLEAEIDRHGNIVVDCSAAPRRGRPRRGLATPILMRVIGGAFALDRQGDGGRALPHVVLLDHPRVRGPRRRHLRPRMGTTWPSRTRRRCSWARCRRS